MSSSSWAKRSSPAAARRLMLRTPSPLTRKITGPLPSALPRAAASQLPGSTSPLGEMDGRVVGGGRGA
jgi:hypothetical protein